MVVSKKGRAVELVHQLCSIEQIQEGSLFPKYSLLLPILANELPPMTIVDGALEPERSFYDQVSTK